MPPASSFFLKFKSFFLFIWNLIKKWIKGPANVNVEHARDVLIVAPTITAGRDVREIIITVKPSHWPEKAKAAESVVPTVITLPTTSSLDQRAMLVYKGIMKSLKKASKVLDPVLAQALYLCSTYKAAILANDDDLAKFVEAKLQKLSTFRAEGGYIPPDITRWYRRFIAIDLRGNLAGVVIPVLELASEKATIDRSKFSEIGQECRRFMRWLYTSMTKLEEKHFIFKGKHLSVGLVFVAEMNWAEYLGIAAELLKEEECDILIVMAYGAEYSVKSVNVACLLNSLQTLEVGLSRVILTPKLEAEPFLGSYFVFQSHFSEQKTGLTEEWNKWELKVPRKSKITIQDEKIGFATISRLISHRKTIIVSHAWNTKTQFLEACFEVIMQNKAKIICYKTEIRNDGGPTQDKPTPYISFVLGPSESF